MDVLYNNNAMDVRDLLANPNIDDPSTPLSAPDLRLLIDRLQVHSLRIKSKVQSYLLSHHSHFSSLFSQCNDAVSRSSHLYTHLLNLLSLLSSDDHPLESTVKALIDDAVSKSKELRLKTELLQLLGVVLELSDKLEDVKREVRAGRVKEAAVALRDLKKALRASDDVAAAAVAEGSDPVVYGLLREEWAHCFEEIQDVLMRVIENAVRFDRESNAVRLKHSPSVNGVDIELPTVLEAMDAVGILDYGLAKVADMIIKHVITPVVNGRSTISIMDEINQYPGHISEAVLEIVPLSGNKCDHVDGETMYPAIINVIKFVNKSLCLQSGPWMRSFGRLTWPRMSELIISNFLSKVVPDDASKLADFQKIVKLTSEFETALKELLFISSDSKDERLSLFADNVEVHFASRKKVEILAKARNLLLQSEFIFPQEYRGTDKSKNQGNFPALTVDLLFSSERCIVSEAASKLMELVHQTLKDVCLSSSRVGLEYYHAARDALLLYEAVIPTKLERQLDAVNQAAVLVHNDCLYLSGEILGLAFEYRSAFPSTVKERAVFIDLAPRLQLLGEQVLQRQVQLVMYNLKEAIDGADGFQNTHQVKQYESAKFSMDQVVFILEKVRMIWEPLLLPSIYERCMSMVLEAIFSRIAKDILLLDDMAAEETLQLRSLILLLLENLSSLLESLLGNNQKGKSQEGQLHALDNPLLSLQKLRKLADLLDMPLKSITASWESGELVRCGFSLSEVEDFIKAIFTDSPLRKECLFRVESSCL